MRVLIDADTLAYAASAVAENENEQIARWNANTMVLDTLRKLNTEEYQLYLTGDNNFRYSIYPEYKANRLKMQRPQYLPVVRQHLMDEWGAFMSDGCEADDMLGVDSIAAEDETILCSIDKDLDQIVGWHYNPRKETTYLVSPLEALRFFYYQLLVGDTADNIKGVKGVGPKKAEKILDGLVTEKEMFEAVRDAYDNEEEMLMNGKVLWIWKQPDDIWRFPTFDEEEYTLDTSA